MSQKVCEGRTVSVDLDRAMPKDDDDDDEASVNNAIEHLRNDEHTKCAIQSGILYK